MKSDKRGFTLIELLVVIAIIGLLASIVLASLNSARKKSRDARRVADLKQLQNALELYANDVSGTYPTCATCTGGGASAVILNTADAPNLSPTYIATLPVDPVTGSNYKYRTNLTTNATNYCVGTYLEGGALQNTASSTCQAAVQLVDGVATNGVAGQFLNYAVGN